MLGSGQTETGDTGEEQSMLIISFDIKVIFKKIRSGRPNSQFLILL
jgi:hypothetical protein